MSILEAEVTAERVSRPDGQFAACQEARKLCLPEEADDICQEYITEVEEIEGEEYWSTFETPEEVRTDFRMWWENRS